MKKKNESSRGHYRAARLTFLSTFQGMAEAIPAAGLPATRCYDRPGKLVWLFSTFFATHSRAARYRGILIHGTSIPASNESYELQSGLTHFRYLAISVCADQPARAMRPRVIPFPPVITGSLREVPGRAAMAFNISGAGDDHAA